MRISPSTIVTSSPYRGFMVNAGPSTPCFKKPLDRLIDRFDSITTRYPSVMFVMVTLKFPQKMEYEQGNCYVVRAMNSLARHLNDNGLPHEYIWTPERSTDGGLHFHLVLAVATNWQEAFHVIVGKLKEYWASAIGIADADGLVDYSSADNGTIISQGTPDFSQALNASVYHGSYATKVSSKVNLPPHGKGFGASQLMPLAPVIL